MSFIANLIYQKILALNFQSPLVYIDTFIASFLVVGFLVYLHRFPSFRVVLGTLFLFGSSLALFISGLLFTSLVLGFASFWILISLPLIFSEEVRHYLGKIGRFNFLHSLLMLKSKKNEEFIRNLVSTLYELAEREIGATIVIERKTGLGQTIDTGIIVNANFGSKLLQTIFSKKSPLHDGAVVIRNGRIIAASCLLPIHGGIKLDPPFGTRHRSGLAITQDTDAVVLIVSEQRGEVSLAENGKLEVNLNRPALTQKLESLL